MLNWKSIPPLVRIPLAYGLLGGLLSVGFVIMFYYFGKHPFLIPPFFDSRILVIAILTFFALKEVRDYFLGGILFFWQAMAGCLVFLGGMMAVGFIGIYVFGTFQAGFVTKYIEQGMAQIRAIPPESVKQIGQQAVDEVLKTLPTTTLTDMTLKYTSQTIAIGFFVTIIISVILRRQPKPL